MTPLTSADIRTNDRINEFVLAQGFPDNVSGNAALDEELILAWAYIEARSCRDLDTLDANSTLGIVAKRAVLLRLVQQMVHESTDYSEDALAGLIKSFSVPGYSETRTDGAKTLKENWMLNPLMALHDLLRILITDDCWDRWKADLRDDEVPASAYREVNWFTEPYSNF